MKKYIALTLLLAAAFSLPLFGGPVSPERAVKVAESILNGQRDDGMSYGALRIVWTGDEPVTKADDSTPPFYVVASSIGGFVIVAGDDNVRPVLALSERNVFSTENMPDNVKWWMDDMARYVHSVTEQTDEVRQLWEGYTATKAATINGTITNKVEHLTPEWDQGNNDPYYFGHYVFNKYCPQQNSTPSVTGCVATAMAEILTVQSGLYPDVMPVSGTGEVGGYPASSGCVAPAAYTLETVYDWAGLRTLTNIAAVKQASEELQDNLAHLMADCGAMVEADYSVSGTGAFSANVPGCLAEHMGYNKGAYVDQPAYYSRQEWENKLVAELTERPMYYSGNGHAFVFDGYGEYDGNYVFHVNFGWGGSCNGYYYQTKLDTGGSDYASPYAEAVFSLYPDPQGEGEYVKILRLQDRGNGYIGLTTEGEIRQNESFVVRIGIIANYSSQVYNGKWALHLEDKDGVFKEVLLEKDFTDIGVGWGYWFYDYVTITEPLAFGDKIVPYYTTDDANTNWVRIEGPVDGSIIAELPVFPSAFIRTKPSYNVGDVFVLELVNQDYRYAGTRWTIAGPSGMTVIEKSGESVKLTQAGTYTILAQVRETSDSPFIENIYARITVN